MKKLITLAVAVLAGALLFTGCYSEIAPEYNKQSIIDAANAEAEAAAKAAYGYCTIPEGATTLYDFSKMTSIPDTIKNDGWTGISYTLVADKYFGKVLRITPSATNDWGSISLKYSTPLNLTGKKLYVVMKGATDVANQDNDSKLIFMQDADNQNETRWIPNDNSKFKVYEYDLAAGTWGAYGKTALTSWNSISEINLAVQKGKYSRDVAYIYYK